MEWTDLFPVLSDMDAQSLSAEEYADYKNQYRWFVALALIALLVALALPRYRPPVNDPEPVD